MKILKKILIGILGFFFVAFLLIFTNVIWRSPSYYKVEKQRTIASAVMDMPTYEIIMATHRRPYMYSITAANGAKVQVVGVEHINTPENPQFDSIRTAWRANEPDIALVEGRMGFFFSWIHHPIEMYGESGLTASLAKKNAVDLYTWEPSREDEIQLLLKKYSKEQLALFYILRPYLGRTFSNPEKRIQELIDSRTDYEGLRNTFQTADDLDKEWKKHYPTLDWRTYSNARGMMPDGVMYDMWNSSNLARDEHMIQIILESLEKEKNVFVTMGSSHAPRIEEALRMSLE